MGQQFKDIQKFFEDNRSKLIVGIAALVVIITVVQGRLRPRTQIPSEEPEISVFFHKTDEVKSMLLETYLEGVVAAEMDPNWPLPALEAQAIVARTFTLKKLGEGTVGEHNAQASTDPREFQAYDETRINDKVKQAVQNTRGQIITYGGEPIRAWFHSSSGGQTASAAEGLDFTKESAPYAQSIKDVQQEPSHEWTYTFSADEVVKAANTLGLQIDRVDSISVGKKGTSGRAETININGKAVPAPQFRLAIGDKTMRSTLIDTLNFEDNSIYMKGRGFGHGVGMSQWGAWLLAQQGKTAQDIVMYYYKGVRIQDTWE